MMTLLKNRLFIAIASVVVLVVLAFGIHEGIVVANAHRTFENYYAFRGCVQLIDRTDTSGDCKLADGETIKIVLFRGQWYLDGDLPTCWHNYCL